MEAKWHVFDEADCFDSFDDATKAAEYAAGLVKQGFTGIHIAFMTQIQFNHYLTHSNLSLAFKESK